MTNPQPTVDPGKVQDASGATGPHLPLETFSDFSTPFSGLIVVAVIGFLLFGLFYAVGAAKLSWCYNSSLGASTGVKLIWAVLAYFFSATYYPYYAFFLDENCAAAIPAPSSNTNQKGGRRLRLSRRHTSRR